MRLFFVLVCCLAIPLVARAADQGKNKKEKQTTQGHQPQAATQSKHSGANTVSHATLNNSSQLKSQGEHHALKAQNSNVRVARSNTSDKVATKHSANTASPLKLNNSSQSKGEHHALKVQNNNARVVQSNTKVATKHSANTASPLKLNNSSQSKGERHALKVQNNKLAGVQSSTKGKVTSQHFALSSSRNPKIASAKFSQNYRIQGSQNWQGQQYGAFQNYSSQWHDQGYWNSNYDRIVLISGGWYFWNAGYWYPAWGYDSAYAYYPYDGPIYAYNDLPPDQVVANVQSTLRAQGYYHGAVDGTLGPVTRAALATYQRDNGLYATAAIDEPTLESLGMG